MRGNHFESVMGITGFGESHGRATGVILEDIKPGMDFPLAQIEAALAMRRPGQKPFSSPRQEKDTIHVLSGVLNGKTTGMPVCLLVYNQDQRSSDYDELRDIFRPGHADFSLFKKFKIYDWRGGGRASGRETIARVAAGAVVQKMLGEIKIETYPVRIGKVISQSRDDDFVNPLYWPERDSYDNVLNELNKAQQTGDSLGGIIEVMIKNMPGGLGDPVFGKLDAGLAGAILSIGGIKGIEFGAGFDLAAMTGSEANDEMDRNGFRSNNCGGILGGISTGEPVVFRIAVKPTSSIKKQQKTIDRQGNERKIIIKGRHDVCLITRIIPVVTAMIRLVLADSLSYQKLVNGNNRDLTDHREAIDKIDEDILISLKKREEISRAVAACKKTNELDIIDGKRETEIFDQLTVYAGKLDLDQQMVHDIWKKIILRSRRIQNEILAKETKADPGSRK